jgi:hypothetical protein
MDSTREQGLVTWTHVIYALHAFSLLIGIVGVATVFGPFLPVGHRSSPSSSTT